MFPTLLTLALLVSPAIRGVLAGQPTIDTPTLTQCQNAHITWTHGTGPYNLIVVHASDPCGDALADLGDHTGNSITWKARLVAGTEVEISLEDSTGAESWTGSITVGKSDDTSCLSAAQQKQISSSTGSSNSPPNSPSNSTSNKKPADSHGSGNGTTLIVTPTTTLKVPSHTPVPVGGVGNAGANPLKSSAFTMRQASTPAMVLGVLAAILVASL